MLDLYYRESTLVVLCQIHEKGDLNGREIPGEDPN